MSKRAFETRAGETKAAYTPGRTFQVAEDIIPIAELKSRLSEVVRGLDARPRPLVITLNGKPAAVVMSPREYDRLTYRERFMAAVNEGLADEAAGRGYTSDEVREHLRKRYGGPEPTPTPAKRKRK